MVQNMLLLSKIVYYIECRLIGDGWKFQIIKIGITQLQYELQKLGEALITMLCQISALCTSEVPGST